MAVRIHSPAHAQECRSLLICEYLSELLDPRNIGKIIISPRQRAQKTFELLFAKHESELACHDDPEGVKLITEDVREWDYGDFEGLKPNEILAKQPGWKIWSDG